MYKYSYKYFHCCEELWTSHGHRISPVDKNRDFIIFSPQFLTLSLMSCVDVSPYSEVQYVVLQNVATMSIKRRVSDTCCCLLVVCEI